MIIHAALLAACFGAAYVGFVLLALSQVRHASLVTGGPARRPGRLRWLGAAAIAGSLVAAIARDGWGFGMLLWPLALTIAALGVVATLTWRPHWLRLLLSSPARSVNSCETLGVF